MIKSSLESMLGSGSLKLKVKGPAEMCAIAFELQKQLTLESFMNSEKEV